MLLLDTNALIWFLGDQDALPNSVREEIETSDHVYVSIATFWEMAIKHSKGRLDLSHSITELMEICGSLDISVLQITGEHLNELDKLPFIHSDPFDRLIICQAKVEGLTIVTADSIIPAYDVSVLHIKK